MASFDEKPSSVPDPVLDLAAKKFGVIALTPWQRFAVANTLEGVNQLVVLPTGGGKSICFQLPALLLPGVTLVVVPLLSLLKDQERRLREAGIPSETLRGGQSAAERDRAFGRLAERTSRIAFTVPEALANKSLVSRLREAGVSHLVVDEAHCVSEWGRAFRPAYLKLAECARALGAPLVSAFTATASRAVVDDIGKLLFGERPWTLVAESADRPNIFYRTVPALSKNALLVRLAREAEKPLVVFTRSRSAAELAARLLRRRLGTEDVFFYHAGLDRAERERVEEWFFPSKTGILCATSAYGLGIDKPDIRAAVHRDAPPSVEAYLQESGRAGRDGAAAQAILLHGWDDRAFLSTLSSPMERDRFRLMLDCATGASCRRRAFLSAVGQELPECSGCDVCAGESAVDPEGLSKILEIVKRAPRRYTKRELASLLEGGETPESLKLCLHYHWGFGYLREWEREDLEEALEILEAQKLIRAPERGFFRHRYTLGRRNRR